jgi:hypothetical protein
MKGHIRQRGANSWELKFDAGRDPVNGTRKIAYHSFKGTKRQAQAKLAELITSVGKGALCRPLVGDGRRACPCAHRAMGSARQDHTEDSRALP